MKARHGQVALYLAMVILAIAVLMIVNVNAFLAVRSKNRMMNAVDEAALAAAKYQGRLLNEVGRMNVEHLRAAIRGEAWEDEEGNDKLLELRRMVFLDPVKALGAANDAARDWGYESGEVPEALAGFYDHIAEIRGNPDLYSDGGSEAWGENLWQTYAAALESALGGSPAVLPSYMEMVNPGTSGLFANRAFYDVIAAKAWCWFTVGNNGQYLDMNPSQMPPPEIYPVEIPENSEVFSLHVTYKGWLDSDWKDEYKSGIGFSERWTNFVCQVTGLTREDFSPRSTAADPEQTWAFYDGNWKKWSTSFNPDNFPIAGSVKPEYDVAGCLASCMMIGHIQQLRRDDKTESVNSTLVTAEAKPIGSVEDPDGGIAPVTAYNSFIAPSRPGARIFTEAQLVLMGSVPRSPGVSMAPGWYEHVKKHSPEKPQGGCEYCSLWAQWLLPSFRAEAQSWLSHNKESCRAKGGSGPAQKGGYEYAH